MSWTITYKTGVDAVTKTLSEWGITDAVVRLGQAGNDSMTLAIDGENLSAAQSFNHYEQIVLKDRSETRFIGWVIDVPAEGDGDGQGKLYDVQGASYQLGEQLFMQPWYVYLNGTRVNAETGHIALNRTTGGVLGTVKQQIESILDYAIQKGRTISYAAANILPLRSGLYPPVDEVRDLTCLECIGRGLRWVPDGVPWCDYSGTVPTFHFRTQDELPAVTLSYGQSVADGKVTNISLKPRRDLQRSRVVINYEVTTNVDGQDSRGLVRDAWPAGSTGSEFGALVMSYEMSGGSMSSVRGQLVCETVELTAAWLKDHLPELKSTLIMNLTVVEVNRTGAGAGLPRMILAGQFAPWMKVGTAVLSAEKDRIVAKVKYDVVNTAGGVVQGDVVREVAFDFTATDAPAGERTYSALASVTEGDSIPPFYPSTDALAKHLWTGLQVLHYEGSMTLTERSPSFSVTPGMVVNITGGLLAWETMRAVVQGVTINIKTGMTQIAVGPLRALGPAELIDLLRVSRPRRVWTNPAAQFSGELGGGNEVDLGEIGANDNGVGVNISVKKQVWEEDTALDTNKITHDPVAGEVKVVRGATHVRSQAIGIHTITAAGTGNQVVINGAACNGHPLAIREIKGCDPATGLPKYRLAIVSAEYDTPINLA